MDVFLTYSFKIPIYTSNTHKQYNRPQTRPSESISNKWHCRIQKILYSFFNKMKEQYMQIYLFFDFLVFFDFYIYILLCTKYNFICYLQINIPKMKVVNIKILSRFILHIIYNHVIYLTRKILSMQNLYVCHVNFACTATQ